MKPHEVKSLILQHEIIVPPGSKIKFNDTTDLFDDDVIAKIPPEQREKNADLAFALATKMSDLINLDELGPLPL